MPTPKTEAAAPNEARLEYMPIGQLRPTPGNPKAHDIPALQASLRRFGFTSPLIMNERTGTIAAGHGRCEALMMMKWHGGAPPARVRVVDGEWHVPVIRGVSFANDREAEAYLVADNRLPELGGWNDGALAAMMANITNGLAGDDLVAILSGTGIDPGKELQEILSHQSTVTGGASGANDDEPAVPPPVAVAKLGELWLLGEHRLLCGDSTKTEDVARLMGDAKAVLMATDPPYGVDYTATKSGMPVGGLEDAQERWGDIENDALPPAELEAFLVRMLAAAALGETAAIYVWHPSGELNHVFRTAMKRSGLLVHRQIVWSKPGFVLTRSGMYHWSHETCFYGWRQGNVPPWYGEKDQQSVWHVGRDEGKAVHPTQKPIELFTRPMLNHTVKGEVCYEPFSGSGSQIIAGEKLQRRVFAMELSPRWVDAAVTRWEKYTGKKARVAR